MGGGEGVVIYKDIFMCICCFSLQRWIDNKKRKFVDKDEQQKKQLPVSTANRKKSGYDLFRSDFLKTNSELLLILNCY